MTLGRRVLVAGVVAALSMACLSPTLPLPPPEVSSATYIPGSNPSMYHLVGTAEPNAQLYIENLNTTDWTIDQQAAGALADPKGNWAKDIFGKPADVIHITQNQGELKSITLQ